MKNNDVVPGQNNSVLIMAGLHLVRGHLRAGSTLFDRGGLRPLCCSCRCCRADRGFPTSCLTDSVGSEQSILQRNRAPDRHQSSAVNGQFIERFVSILNGLSRQAASDAVMYMSKLVVCAMFVRFVEEDSVTSWLIHVICISKINGPT